VFVSVEIYLGGILGIDKIAFSGILVVLETMV